MLGLDTVNEIVGGKSGSVTVGGVTVGTVTVGTTAFIVGAAGGITFITGALKLIASGFSGVIGFLSAIFIAPFTTCFGLTPALTSNPTIGSCTSPTLTKP